MRLSREARQILEILAEERERNPRTHGKGISRKVLGARIGAYLGNVMYPVEELICVG